MLTPFDAAIRHYHRASTASCHAATYAIFMMMLAAALSVIRWPPLLRQLLLILRLAFRFFLLELSFCHAIDGAGRQRAPCRRGVSCRAIFSPMPAP